jgi:hypothetical protein
VKHSTGAMTVYESWRVDKFRLIGCIACWMLGHPETPYDVQHLLSGNKRRGHDDTIPLCPAHHRGVGFSAREHLACFAHTTTGFRELFGSDDELIELTDRLIRVKTRQFLIPHPFLSEAERMHE